MTATVDAPIVKLVRCEFRQLALLAMLFAAVQADATTLFDDNSVLEVELAGPIDSLIANKQDRMSLPFVLRASGVEHSVKVRVRGHSRMRVCKFPPLRISFSGDDTRNTVYAGQHKLKLVTECRGHRQARANVLQEFAAYRIFNLLSEASYKVRLLKVTYTDTDGRLKDNLREQYGFLIESDAELSKRLDALPVQLKGVRRSQLDAEQAAAVFVFQYLIGNTDWSLVVADGDDKCCHNGDLFKTELKLYYVPYDFDLAGLVNARYARPDSSLGIKRVTQRRYRGYCIPSDSLLAAIQAFKARRPDILAVLSEITALAPKDARESVEYLETFFAEAEDDAQLARSFDKRCL